MKKSLLTLMLLTLLMAAPAGLSAQISPVGNTADYYRSSIKLHSMGLEPGNTGRTAEYILNNITEGTMTQSQATPAEFQIYYELKSKIDQAAAIAANNPSFFVVVICNESYGLLTGCWNDTQSFGSFQDTGFKIMTDIWFFKLK